MTPFEMEEHCILQLMQYQQNNDLSQKELAQKLGISENTLGRMLARKTHVLGDSLSLMHNLNKLTGKMVFELAGVDVSYSPRLSLLKCVSNLPDEYLDPLFQFIRTILHEEDNNMDYSASLVQEAADLLLAQYIKILKVNLTQDTYEVGLVRPDEWEARKSAVSNRKISSWFHDFAESDYMNPADHEDFLVFTNLKNLRTHLRHTSNLRFKYQRKVDHVFQDVVMDIIRVDAKDTDDQIAMLYIRTAEHLYE